MTIHRETYIVAVYTNDGKWNPQDTISVRAEFLTSDIKNELIRKFFICMGWDVRIQARVDNQGICYYVMWNGTPIVAVRKGKI